MAPCNENKVETKYQKNLNTWEVSCQKCGVQLVCLRCLQPPAASLECGDLEGPGPGADNGRHPLTTTDDEQRPFHVPLPPTATFHRISHGVGLKQPAYVKPSAQMSECCTRTGSRDHVHSYHMWQHRHLREVLYVAWWHFSDHCSKPMDGLGRITKLCPGCRQALMEFWTRRNCWRSNALPLSVCVSGGSHPKAEIWREDGWGGGHTSFAAKWSTCKCSLACSWGAVSCSSGLRHRMFCYMSHSMSHSVPSLLPAGQWRQMHDKEVCNILVPGA